LVEGWFLFLKGSVEQRRFRDDPNDVEFKVRYIELLADIREKFIARLRLQIDIAALDENRLDHLGKLVEEHPGQVGLTFEMYDAGSALEMPSRTRKVELNEGFVEALEELVVAGGVKYRLEMAK
jgi:hypothetical protein